MELSLPRVPARVVAIASALAVAAAVVAASPFSAADEVSEPDTERFAGDNRFDTAAQLADAAYPAGADDVIIATGHNFPDALAAGGLSGLVDAPILLVNDVLDEVPAETADALASLDPDTVHVAGSEMAISAEIYNEIAGEGAWDMNRIGGADRFETAALMADAFSPADVADSTAIVATGFTAADALAAGPLAHAGPHPVLLTRVDELPQVTADALVDLEVDTVVVLGGENAAVSAEVASDIEDLDGIDTVTRAAGDNRFETAVEIAGLTGFAGENVMLATGYGPDDVPADALAGGAYGAKHDAVLLPINDVLDEMPAAIEGYLEANAAMIDKVVSLGGTTAVSENVADTAADAAAHEEDEEVPEEPESNMTIDVASEDTDPIVPEGSDRTYTADLSDVSNATVALVDADDATTDNGEVFFTNVAEHDGDFTVNFYDGDAEIQDVTVDGVVISGSDQMFTDLTGDSVEFTVEHAGDAVALHAVVFADDGSGELATDVNGAPQVTFGAGASVQFVDVAEVAVEDRERIAPAGEATSVEVSLVDGDEDGVPLDGQEVRFRADDTEQADYDSVNPDTAVDTGVAMTDEGVVVLDVDAAEAEIGDEWFVYVRWTGSGPFEGEILEDLPEITGDRHVKIEFVDPDPVIEDSSVEVDPGMAAVEVGGTMTLTASVTDQFGEPFEGAAVEFDSDAFSAQEETTDEEGVATFSYAPAGDASEDLSDADEVTATLLDEEGDPSAVEAQVAVWRYAHAEEGVTVAAGEVVAADTDVDGGTLWAFGTPDEGSEQLLAFDLADGAPMVPQIDGDNVGRATFNDALNDGIDDNPPFLESGNVGAVDIDGYADGDLTTFNLTSI